jgi:anaerobic ribonucleoside-triphosphate reductase activating protein
MDSVIDFPVAISRIHFPVTTLGPGRRAGIWFQGCSIQCSGCVSRDTWTAGVGTSVREVVIEVARFKDAGLTGITISGGEPFDQPLGLDFLLTALQQSVELYDLDVFVYSGYTLSTLRRQHPAILGKIDALMSGPYVDSRPTELPWRGSGNQVLSLLTERGRARYTMALSSEPPSRELQVSVHGGAVWITGIPRRGDLERLRSGLSQQGIELKEASWLT